MEKLLASFLKSLGITPELIQERINIFLATVERFERRIEYLELRQKRFEVMLIRLCEKSGVSLTDIYAAMDLPSVDHDTATKPEKPEERNI